MRNSVELVLIADDNKADQLAFSAVIVDLNMGIAVQQAPTCELLLLQLDCMTVLPDFIFLDLNIPRMGGLNCLKQIKLNPLWAHIPVIIYSASYETTNVKAAFTEGAARYVYKPADAEALKRILLQVFTSHQARPGGLVFESFVLREGN